MVLLPEDSAMTLAELRQMAARQQHQIEAQQQLLVAKEQRLKFLKQQEARHHSGGGDPQLDPQSLQILRDKIDNQELKLRQLRTLRGQVEQQKTNNENLGTELDSIRTLFSEKEKELNLAVNKVDELARQLDEIRNNKNRNNNKTSSSAEIEKLRRELMYRTKLSEQQNNYICKQREDIALRHQDISLLDKKINELSQRLHRKRLLNEQLSAQIHNTAIARNHMSRSSGPYTPTNVVAVEPLLRETTEPEHTRDDIATKFHGRKNDLGEFALTKNDPKYQTLPYNTKFTLKGKSEDSLSSSADDDSWPNSLDSAVSLKKMPPLSVVKPSPVLNPTSNAANPSAQCVDNHVILTAIDVEREDVPQPLSLDGLTTETKKINPVPNNDTINNNGSVTPNQKSEVSVTESKPKLLVVKSSKPAVPPKPALPVKPIIASRHALFSAKEKDSNTVNAALSVLQKKSTRTDKSIYRYHNKESAPLEPPPSKSKLATYFQKTLIDSSGVSEPRQRNDNSDAARRKPAVGQSHQLPIKPKPLTIRKTPGLEPPKLKVQPVVSTNFGIRKPSDSNLVVHLKKTATLQSDDELISSPKSSKSGGSEDRIDRSHLPEDSLPVVEVAPMKAESPEKISKAANKEDQTVLDVEVQPKNLEQETEKLEYAMSEEELDGVCALRRAMRKGNLKIGNTTEKGSRNRRVSFDPLALLLDAALEGELELVKKTATEVPNPSAANDEGITALHNAICAGHVEVVTFLVDFGCDVNAQDSDGWTPLHCAASCNNLPLVKFLVERGACVFATTLSDHETAAEKCEEDEEGFENCSQYLYNLQEELGMSSDIYAVYDYEAQNSDELGFCDGDRLTVLRRGDDDECDWWWARRQDHEGYVPRNLLGLYPRVTAKKESESSQSSD